MQQIALNSVAAEPIAGDGALDIGEQPIVQTRAAETPRMAQKIKRWIWMNRGRFRAAAVGCVALLLFLVAWHFLTKYRVNIYVRFINVPSPEAVLERARREGPGGWGDVFARSAG